MDINKLTLKSQEALAEAQRLARDNNNQQVETGHLLMALLGQTEGLILPLLQKI
ncbi:MAG: Clp protease N-terminal domain-containing protein, partial [Actinomycetota bacterium]